MNTGAANAQVTFRLYTEYFILVATRTLDSMIGNFRPGDHFARYATEIFPEIRASGLEKAVITVESTQPLAAVTLRQHDHPGLVFPAEVNLVTVFPVLTGRAAQ